MLKYFEGEFATYARFYFLFIFYLISNKLNSVPCRLPEFNCCC